LDVVQMLIDSGADSSLCDGTSSTTALMLAAAAGHCECASAILKSRNSAALVTMVDCEGRSPLLYAARRGHTKVLRLLLDALPVERMYDADVADETGLTPLMAAAATGQLSALELLLQSGRASILATDSTGATALHAAAWGGHLDAVYALLHAGALVDARDSDGKTPLDHVSHDDPELQAALEAALDAEYECYSEKSYDSAQDDRPWH
jgi:ankyrin repeat protein